MQDELIFDLIFWPLVILSIIPLVAFFYAGYHSKRFLRHWLPDPPTVTSLLN